MLEKPREKPVCVLASHFLLLTVPLAVFGLLLNIRALYSLFPDTLFVFFYLTILSVTPVNMTFGCLWYKGRVVLDTVYYVVWSRRQGTSLLPE